MRDAVKRGVAVALGLIIQFALTYLFYIVLGKYIGIIGILYELLGFILIMGLIKNSKSYSYTLPWIILILLFPLPATLMYFILGGNKINSKIFKSIRKSETENKKYLVQDPTIKKEFANNGRLRYLSDFSGYPVTKNDDIDYFPLGEKALPAMLEDLKNAKNFIFLEYFIINHGKMWSSILEILEKKAAEGLDVRIMYDDLGCFTTLDKNYPQELEKKGIKCVVFNKLSTGSGIIMNNRDHRKILVIDGIIAYTGGINIADEYINEIVKHGHWKDNAIRISGDSIWSFTVMFLSMWNSFEQTDEDFNIFKREFKKTKKDAGYVAVYGETPLDDEVTGEDVYLNIINQATDYIYIATPYLIIDTDMINALGLAAKRGVDVRIVIPGIPDKRIVYTLSESYIEPLVKSGVKIYKYTPGFVHSKVFVADDHIATVGTINMDYRSLYLHFECGVYMEDGNYIEDIKKDLDFMISKSHQVTEKEATPHLLKGIWQAILRLFAPLM